MGESPLRRVAAWVVAVLAVGPLVVLPLRAVADVWRAPALLPQQFGLRGWEVVASPGNRVGAAVVASVVVAVTTTAVGLVLGWPAARVVARLRGAARTTAVVGLAAPLLVPPISVGLGLTGWFLRLGLADSLPGLVVAHLVYVLPYVVLVLVPAFDRRVLALEEVAATAGGRGWRRLVVVTLPSIAPTVATAALLGFVVSWSQYGTSLVVAGGRATLPVVLVPFVGRDPQVAAALALVFLAVPVVALAVAVRALRSQDGGVGTGVPAPAAMVTGG